MRSRSILGLPCLLLASTSTASTAFAPAPRLPLSYLRRRELVAKAQQQQQQAASHAGRAAARASRRLVSSAVEAPAEKPPFYITTPIYYVNGMPHIGHAYTTLACDVLARFKRLDGHEVKFLTGTDEHGQKVEQSALAAGETPQAFADRVSGIFRSLLDVYDFSADECVRTRAAALVHVTRHAARLACARRLAALSLRSFIRTTEPRHREAVQALWRKLLDAGDIYLGAYEGV